MSHQDKPRHVVADPLEFARDERRLGGEVGIAALERLADGLADKAGTIVWTMWGEVGLDAMGVKRRFLCLEASGELQLVCQRCLGPMAWPLRLDSRLALMAPGEEWPEEELEDDSCDAIEAEQDLDAVALLEDEILLALPNAPRHPVCTLPGDGAHQSEKVSPFAVLAGLKK